MTPTKLKKSPDVICVQLLCSGKVLMWTLCISKMGWIPKLYPPLFFFFFLKAAHRFLRVGGSRQNPQVPRWRQTVSAKPLENPPVSHDLGRTDTAVTADRDRQETVCEDLGLWDAAGLAVGERVSLTNGRAEAATVRRTKRIERRCHFPVSQQHKVCSRCRAVIW